MAEAAALARALDQAGYVGDGERRLAGGDHAEVGHQRGERVVGDLGPGPGDGGDQAGLAGAREADQPDVGDHLELEHDLELVAGLAEQREAGRLALGGRPAPRCRVRRGRPAAITSSVPGPTRSASTSPLTSVTTVPSGTGSTRSAPWPPLRWLPAPCPPCSACRLRAVVVVDQGGDVRVDPQDHRAAGTAVAAVGAAERLELLAVHRGDAVAAAAGADVQRHPVDERRDGHGTALSGDTTKGAPDQGRPSSVAVVGMSVRSRRPGRC